VGAGVIRHQPEGCDHHSLVEPDQRVPLRPLGGRPCELRGVYALRFSLRLEAGERVIGFGERFDDPGARVRNETETELQEAI
jgi:hypothetical protein